MAKPVFSAIRDGAQTKIQTLYGTALPIAADLVLTAEHVGANIFAQAPDIAIGWGAPGQALQHGVAVPFTLASVMARWPEVDLAALRLPAPLDRQPGWDMGIRPMLTTVAAIGYAYGLDAVDNSLASRGFLGTSPEFVTIPAFQGNPSSMSYLLRHPEAFPADLSFAATESAGLWSPTIRPRCKSSQMRSEKKRLA